MLRPGADDERGRRAPAQRRPQHDHRARRRAAAGAGAALQPHRARRARTAAPAHAGPALAAEVARRLGRSPRRRGSTPVLGPAGRRSKAACADRMGTLVVLVHAHPDDEALRRGGTDRPGQRRGPPGRARRATNGEHGEVPDDLAAGETLVDRRRAETERVGRRPRHRTASSGSATATRGMTGLGAERRPGVVPAGADVDEAGRAAGRACCARSTPTSSSSTTGTAATATPTTSRSTASATAPPSWPGRRRSSRRR